MLGGGTEVPVGGLAALVAGARAMIVGDTGFAQGGSALGTPSVVLFGPSRARDLEPPDLPGTASCGTQDHIGGARPGDAHGDQPDDRLLRIAAAEVLTAVAQLPGPDLASAGEQSGA